MKHVLIMSSGGCGGGGVVLGGERLSLLKCVILMLNIPG